MNNQSGQLGKFNLDERLVTFSLQVIKIMESLLGTKTSTHIQGQLLRCATSAAANYAEAQGAESRKDFLHKIRLVLKELRETRVWLIMIGRLQLSTTIIPVQDVIRENDELISIFVKSIQTTKERMRFKS